MKDLAQPANSSTNVIAKPNCKHCDKHAEWRWDDADGNEHAYICERCMETVSGYMYFPLWQFTPLAYKPVLSPSPVAVPQNFPASRLLAELREVYCDLTLEDRLRVKQEMQELVAAMDGAQ